MTWAKTKTQPVKRVDARASVYQHDGSPYKPRCTTGRFARPGHEPAGTVRQRPRVTAP